ncbi:tRNA pseudouridine(38-40) synthase TruA [Priestia endophytica]|uniref:tRNA pseudouridine(38-40) synthase TruA n=1 Tax=Priestia endophytica TaxID=135735 RepID=UPI00228321F1|nr:tRNA pseudouridine(38-40) synthase TruA [Priestia endophytica]MCY8232423.1 tRNA pseudouridine(38-40) synthase TruA [Priestia endophytica]
MRRIQCTVAYDGTLFSGYQIQPNARTVQEEIEKALTRLHGGKEVKIHASGRTDASVHAKGQVFHFDTTSTISVSQLERGANALLPEDIVVVDTKETSEDFHARFSVKKKEYRYKVLCSKSRDVFLRHYMHHVPYDLDRKVMKEAIKGVIGTHDFTSFCSAKTEIEDKVRTIYEAEIIEEGDVLTFRFVGNGFLYNMVRILVGTLLDLGNGKSFTKDISGMLEAKNRTLTGKTAPGHGLYLWKVYYDN